MNTKPSNRFVKSAWGRSLLGAVFGLILVGFACLAAVAQQRSETPDSTKVYKFPDETQSEKPSDNVAIYRRLSFRDISLEQLTLNLDVAIRPVDREATIRQISFKDVRVNGVPLHIEPMQEEFKLSKKAAVDLPSPLHCSIVFSELESLKPVSDLVEWDRVRITGQSLVEVKLSTVAKVALARRRLVLPVQFNEEVQLHTFSDNPLLQAGVVKILGALSDVSTIAATALDRERMARRNLLSAAESAGRNSVYLLYCEYALRDPKTHAEEKFTEWGTGFVVGAEGKLLTAKRVVQPWKFDPEVAWMIERHQFEPTPSQYRIWAWPAGSRVAWLGGKIDFQAALASESGALKLVKTAPDRMEQQEFQDPDSGKKTKVRVHAAGENDAALLQLAAKDLKPLAFTDPATKLPSDSKAILLSFPYGPYGTYGAIEAQANPQAMVVAPAVRGSVITLDRTLNPGEAGAPLLSPEGNVLGMASGAHECVPAGLITSLIQ